MSVESTSVVPAGGPEAGAGGVTGNGNVAPVTGTPDQIAGQPKGKLDSSQSNDNLPQWTQQLPKKLTTDQNSMAKLATFKSLDDFVQAYLDAAAKAGDGQQLALPGKDSTPEEIQAFYERLGKPKEAASYPFAKSDPALAKAAFDANLSGDQAQALYNASLAQLEDVRRGIQASVAKDFQATDALLVNEYGQRYDEAIALMQRGLGNNPKTGELSAIAKSLLNAGLAGKPEIVRAFIELGRATSEGTATGGRTGIPQPQSVMEGRGFAYKDDYS